MIKVGIIGCGFVGGALKNWLENNNPECKLFISDPYKGYNDDLSDIDIAFLQIHVPTEEDGTQDLTLMKELISKLPDVPVFVRTTILPGTSEMLSRETGHHVYYMPEFLTERTFIEDFNKQTMVFTGAQDLLTKIFVGKKFTVMSPLEAELTKYMHNVFGAYKVPHVRPWSRWQVRLWWQMFPERRQRFRRDDQRHLSWHPLGASPRTQRSLPWCRGAHLKQSQTNYRVNTLQKRVITA